MVGSRLHSRGHGDLLQEDLCQHAAPPRTTAASAPILKPASVDPRLCWRLPNSHRQVWLSLLWGHCSFLLCSGTHKVLSVPSKGLWWVWGLILNMIAPFLPSYCGFSLVLGHGVSFFCRFQHPPVDGCSAVSCNFGVLSGNWVHILLLFSYIHTYIYIYIYIYVYMLGYIYTH